MENSLLESSFFVNNLLGFCIGIIASFLVWFITAKLIVPKIEFSENISRAEPVHYKAPSYKFRMRNKGRRNIMDIDIYFRVRIKGINENYPKTWEVFIIPVGSRGNKITVLKPTTKDFYGTTLQIKVNECKKFEKPFLPKEIIEKSKNEELTLEDILAMGTESEAQIILFGYDEFSGARKYFMSKLYHKNNIIKGKFEYRSMNIKEENKSENHAIAQI